MNLNEQRIVKDQNKLLEEFLNITNTEDLSNPNIPISNQLLRRQQSFSTRLDMEVFRDKEQKEILGKMMLNLRTNKSLFIDEEAQKVRYDYFAYGVEGLFFISTSNLK